MATPGGPLLTVGDMLRDLSEDSSGERLLNPPSFSASSTSGLDAATQNPKSGLADEVLPKSFEETYKQLNAALKQSGHTWTGLTQELCATLTQQTNSLLQRTQTLDNLLRKSRGWRR